MCGIAGIIYKKTKNYQFEGFRNSFQLMQHRGPNNSGYYEKDNIGFYHHRLSIIDLSAKSNQPYQNSENGNILTYNGEIYNYRELAPEFANIHNSDTAVLFHLLNKTGEKSIKDLNGIFAFAYYSSAAEELLLVRDRLGVKPLYYVNTEEYFAFASEAKVLYDHLPTLRLNWQSVHEYLVSGNSINEENIVKGVYKVPPGTIIKFNLKNFSLETRTFWSVQNDILNSSICPSPTYEDAKIQTETLLKSAVERQCISDVPVGAYLSGGIDSSVVVALASKYTHDPLLTFSAAFEGSKNSELPLAREIAKKYRTEHHEFEITTRGIESELKDIILQYDDPFADPAVIPLHLMAKKCREDAKVVLQGDGGDELFAGYGRHLDSSELFKRKIGYLLASKLHPNQTKRNTFKSRANVVMTRPSWKKAAYMVTGLNENSLTEVLLPPYKNKIINTSPYQTYRHIVGQLKEIDPINKILYADMQVVLPYTFLEKVDKINMYHSVEARVPLLDNHLVEYVMKLPGKYKIRKRTTKYLLRDIASDLLPENVLNAKKQSFGTPMDIWINTILYKFIKDTIEKGRKLRVKIFDIDRLLELLANHKNSFADNSRILWRATIFIIWLEHYQNKIPVN